MVPKVKRFDAELHLEPLGEGGVIEHKDVPVLASRTGNGIESQVAVAIWASGASRQAEVARKPLRNGLGIADTARNIGSVSRIGDDASGSIGAADPEVNRGTGFDGDDRRQLPATDQTFLQGRAVPEE